MEMEMYMKKFVSYLLATLFAVTSFALVSCSDDNDDLGSNGNVANGQVSVEFKGATTLSLFAYDATWQAGHQEVNGTILDYLKNGATFKVGLSEDTPSEVVKVGDDYFYDAIATWQFDTDKEIKEGIELEIKSSHWGDGSFDNAGYFCYDCSGTVIVKSVRDNKIVLLFKNFKFDRITSFVVGDSSYQDLIVNGEITFYYED